MITIVQNSKVYKVNQKNNSLYKHYIGEYSNERGIIKELLIHPIRNGIKGEFPGFILGKFKNLEGPRATENLEYKNNNWIVFDIDNKDKTIITQFTIQDFHKDFNEYEYYLHTSSSHLDNGWKHKFRVFIKGKDFHFDIMNIFEKDCYKDLMSNLFPYVDPISFEANRIFYCPNKTNNNYYYKINEGKEYILSQNIFNSFCDAKKRQKNYEKTENERKMKNRSKNNDKILEKTLDTLEQKMHERIAEGSTYEYLRKFISACLQFNIDEQSIRERLIGTPATQKEIDNFFKAWSK